MLPKFPNVAEAGVDPNSRTEGLLNAGVAPFHMQFGEAVLHLRGHLQAGLRVFCIALGFRIAKENRMASPTNLSIVPPCLSATLDISVKYPYRHR